MKFEELPSAESYYDGVRIQGLKSTMVKAIEQAKRDAFNAGLRLAADEVEAGLDFKGMVRVVTIDYDSILKNIIK